MIKSDRNLALFLMMILLAGCATPAQKISKFEFVSQQAYEGDGYTVDLPRNWGYFTVESGKNRSLMATRNRMQSVSIERFNHDEAFSAIGRSSSPGTPPETLADRWLANRKASAAAQSDVQVEASVPALVDGKPGFRLTYTFRAEDGLQFRSVVYGVATSEYLFVLRYQAPVLVYFQQDLSSYQAMVDSFRLKVRA